MSSNYSSIVGAAVKKIYGRDMLKVKKQSKISLARVREIITEIKKYLKEHQLISIVLKIAVVLYVLVSVIYLVVIYNTFTNYRNNCQKYYAQIGVEVKRRENLIPNLILLVSKYSKHEMDIMKHVADARQTIAGSADIGKKIEASKQLEGILSKLLAIAEQYPDLKATDTTRNLIVELTNTENRIAEMKAKYNLNAKDYNDLWYDIPTSWIAQRLFNIQTPIMYIATDEDILKVPLVINEEVQNK